MLYLTIHPPLVNVADSFAAPQPGTAHSRYIFEARVETEASKVSTPVFDTGTTVSTYRDIMESLVLVTTMLPAAVTPFHHAVSAIRDKSKSQGKCVFVSPTFAALIVIDTYPFAAVLNEGVVNVWIKGPLYVHILIDDDGTELSSPA
jgi:hypothetical protein